MSGYINLRSFGYSTNSSNELRHFALKNAVDAHGLQLVINRLNQIKANVENDQTEKDIRHVLSTYDKPIVQKYRKRRETTRGQ